MRRIGAAFLALVLVAAPLFAGDEKTPEEQRAEDEAFAQKLLEIIEKTAEQAESQALDRTPYGSLEGADREVAEEITRRLDNQRIALNFDDTGFSEAIDFLRDVTGLNVVLSRKAKDATDGAGKIKLKLKDIKVRNALELILGQTDPQLCYGVRNGVLEIGTQEDWKSRDLILDVIEIKDLIYRPPDYPAPQAGLDALEKGNAKWKK